jgi:pyruvate kinase
VEFSKGKILLDNAVCASCHKCVRVCPHDIWQVTTSADRTTFINVNAVEDCTLDMQCVQVCPTGAIEIIAKPT